MKKIILSFIIICGFSSSAFCIFGIEKILPDLNLFKQEVKGDLNGIKFENAQLKSEITGLRLQVKELKISLEANLQAIGQVQGDVQKVNGNLTQNKTVINEAGLMWKIIYGLLTLVTLLIGNQFFVVKWLLKEQSNARYYQVELAKQSEPEGFNEIMRQKKDIDKQKSLLDKALRLLNKKGGSNV